VARLMALSDLGARLAAAKEAHAAEQQREAQAQAERLDRAHKTSLLMSTVTALEARAASDQTARGGFLSFGDPLRARPFLPASPAAGAAAEGGGAGGSYWPEGVEPHWLPPQCHTPKSRKEHELVLRVSRAALRTPPGGAAGGGEAPGESQGESPPAVRFLSTLAAAKGHDPRFRFLRPYHPLHAYFQALLGLGLAAVEGLVSALDAVKQGPTSFVVTDLDALAATLDDLGDDHGQATQYLGERHVYPGVWAALLADPRSGQQRTSTRGAGAEGVQGLVGKLTGMLLAMPRQELLPLLADPEALEAAALAAKAALDEAQAEAAQAEAAP